MKSAHLFKKNTKEHRFSGGFALPTVLIVSLIMMMVLMVSVTSIAGARVTLAVQYYNLTAKNASEAGANYAKACLKQNGGVAWANPLKPDTDCTGSQLASCPTSDATNSCHFVVNNVTNNNSQTNIRSSFIIPVPTGQDLDSSSKVASITVTGTTSLLRASNGASWRDYNQTSRLVVSIPTAQVLVVAGGGGGVNNLSGGGGAGGVLYNALYPLTASQTVTVGAGGAVGVNGNDSIFGSITATHGGHGGSRGSSLVIASTGGSGGGGTGYSATNWAYWGADGTSGQGSAGGNGYNAGSPDRGVNSGGGGGGGAGAAGGVGTNATGGNGGAGTINQISGSTVGQLVSGVYYVGGGGGGGSYYTKGTGGSGGGGNGESGTGTAQSVQPGTAGTANTGGGGGGGAGGGSGVVVVAFPTGSMTVDVSSCSTAPVITTNAINGTTIYTFNATITCNFVITSFIRSYNIL